MSLQADFYVDDKPKWQQSRTIISSNLPEKGYFYSSSAKNSTNRNAL